MASSDTSNGTSVANSTKKPTLGAGTAAGDVATTGAFASRAKEALEAWQTLEKALANITSHKQVFSHVAEAVDRHVATEIEIENKDARIACLESAIQTHFEEFAKRLNKWTIDREGLEGKLKKKETALEAQLKIVEQNLTATHAKEVEKIKKALENENKKSTALEVKLADAKSKMKKAEDELARCREEVEDWNDYISELNGVDFNKLSAKIKPLSDRCCALARNHFFCDLADKYFQDEIQWDRLSRTLEVRLAFPPSNSLVAKLVRMAACLHIISRSLCNDIFKPCYFPDSSSFSNGVKEILATQFRTDASKERITRALILSTYPKNATAVAMTQTARVSSMQIQHLLTPLGANEKFAKELEKIFLDAGEIWKNTAQYSDRMIEALTEDDIPGISWATMDEFTISTANTTITTTAAAAAAAAITTTTDTNKDPPHSNMLNLFPCIYVPEGGEVVFPGLRLSYSQGIMSAAEQEFIDCIVARRQWSLRNNTNAVPGGHSTRRERRMSSLPDGKGGVLTTSSVAAAAAAAGNEATQQRGAR